jgi:hypothetical protein
MECSARWAIVFGFVMIVGCAAHHPSSGHFDTVNHVVVCWLKHPGDASARQELIDQSKAFEGHIPGLIHVSAGEMLPSTRPTVDSSYDVAIAMVFRDEASLRSYEKNPVHQRAVRETLQPRVSKLVIYDFIDRTNEKGHSSREHPFTNADKSH